MDSPTAGIIAELKLRLIENKICEKFKNKIKLSLRYVHDVYAKIKEDKPDEILRGLNEIDKNVQNVQFT